MSHGNGCALDAALELLGRTWMLETIRVLLDGPMRFVELRAATGCPSPSTFTRRLRVLEHEGIVAREELPGTPPGARYGLTSRGLGLGRVLRELAAWAERELVPAAADRPGTGVPGSTVAVSR